VQVIAPFTPDRESVALVSNGTLAPEDEVASASILCGTLIMGLFLSILISALVVELVLPALSMTLPVTV